MRQFLSRIHVVAVLVVMVLAPLHLSAEEVITETMRHATVQVVCEDRLGSGVVTDATQGYIMTVGHVPINNETGEQAAQCQVGFITGSGGVPNSFYLADIVHAVLSPKYDLDFAVLKRTTRISGPVFTPSEVPVNLFVDVGQSEIVVGYPGSSENGLTSSSGTIKSFSRGTIDGSAVISEGYSGGPGFDGDGNLMGIASRVTYLIDPDTGEEKDYMYMLGDTATMISWIDALSDDPHETYMRHADADRFSALPYFVREEASGCLDVVRTEASPAVYCLLAEDRRFVFPDVHVFFSWYPNFDEVSWAYSEDIARFRLIGNMTHKAGSLIKIISDPTVYLVTDSFGTLRPIPSEARAIELFGADWSSMVMDVADTFFIDYTVGRVI